MKNLKPTYIFRLVIVLIGLLFAQTSHSTDKVENQHSQEYLLRHYTTVHSVTAIERGFSYAEIETSDENEEFETAHHQFRSSSSYLSKIQIQLPYSLNQRLIDQYSIADILHVKRHIKFEVFRI